MNCEKCNYAGYEKGLDWVLLGFHGPAAYICKSCQSAWNEFFLHADFGRAFDVAFITQRSAIARGDADTAIADLPNFENAIQAVIDAGKLWLLND